MTDQNCCPPREKAQGCCPPDEPPKTAAGCCPPPSDPAPSCCPPSTPETCSPPDSEGPSCCPPSENASCCPPGPADDRPGYRLCSYVSGWLDSPLGRIPQVKTTLERSDLFGRWQMRWGIGRMRYQVTPGIYALGTPGAESPVLVSANYKLSFDIVRRSMHGRSAWILVIDTQGINVWCAAGKGTFGTDEIVRRVNATRLEEIVSHRTLVVPQLGAPGVAAHEVKKRCGFSVAYGPVQARDLPDFLDAGMKATPAMRQVGFGTLERFVLTPVELVGMGKKSLWVALALLILGGIGPDIFSLHGALVRGGTAILVFLTSLLAGAVLTPVLLPWVPGRAFSVKGAIVGGAAALLALPFLAPSLGVLCSLAALLLSASVSSYCAMNFTGSTTFTSPSGVQKEMRRYIPFQGGALGLAALLWIGAAFYGVAS